MDLFSRALALYGTKQAIADKLGKNFTTISRWEKSLTEQRVLSPKVDRLLRSLSPIGKSTEPLVLGFYGAMFFLPVLLAAYRCRQMETQNLRVVTFSASAPAFDALRKGEIHLAVFATSYWEAVSHGSKDLSALVSLGTGPVYGVSGRENIQSPFDLQGMTVFVPNQTGFKDRFDAEFPKFSTSTKIKAISAEEADSELRNEMWNNTAVVGWPGWIEKSIKSIPSKARIPITHHILPRTQAVLTINRAVCPGNPLRHFLLILDRTLTDITAPRVRHETPNIFLGSDRRSTSQRRSEESTFWDIGEPAASGELEVMIAYAKDYADSIATFYHDAGFFTAISLWNDEVNALSAY